MDLGGESDALSQEERRQLQASADDLIAETAGPAALKKALTRIGKNLAPVLIRFVEQMAKAVLRQLRG